MSTECDAPFCEDCEDASEGMNFTAEDVIQELTWALQHTKTIKDAKNYLTKRIADITSDEKDSKKCEECDKFEMPSEKEEVAFT